MASMTWRTASFSASVRCGFQQSINRINRGWSERADLGRERECCERA